MKIMEENLPQEFATADTVPQEFVTADTVFYVFEQAIVALLNAYKVTDNDCNYMYSYSELIEIMEVIRELQWHYGDTAIYKFTREKIPNAVCVSEIVKDIPKGWEDRIQIEELLSTPRVYINF